MALASKLISPLIALVQHRITLGADGRLRRFTFDEALRGRLCAQIEVIASSKGVYASLDLQPDTEDCESQAFEERYNWLNKHWIEVEALALGILNGFQNVSQVIHES